MLLPRKETYFILYFISTMFTRRSSVSIQRVTRDNNVHITISVNKSVCPERLLAWGTMCAVNKEECERERERRRG